MNDNGSPKIGGGGANLPKLPSLGASCPHCLPPPPRLPRPCLCRFRAGGLKAAVHWERHGCALAESSQNLTLAAMGLRADSVRPQRVSGSARTDNRRVESARNPIAIHAKFGDDSALNAFTRTQ